MSSAVACVVESISQRPIYMSADLTSVTTSPVTVILYAAASTTACLESRQSFATRRNSSYDRAGFTAALNAGIIIQLSRPSRTATLHWRPFFYQRHEMTNTSLQLRPSVLARFHSLATLRCEQHCNACVTECNQ